MTIRLQKDIYGRYFNLESSPYPLYLTQTTLPTLTHWCFITWGAQPPHSTDRSPPLMHQPLNHMHSAHLPQRQTWGHMVSSFNFSNHIVLCHLAHPHKSIPSPQSSQCRAPPWRAPINRSHCLDPASVARSRKPIPSIQPESCDPINQSHCPDPASVARPHCAPPPPSPPTHTNQSHRLNPIVRPHDVSL